MDHGGEGLMRVRLLTDRFRIREGNKIRYFTKGDVFEAGDPQGQRLVKIGAAVPAGVIAEQTVDEGEDHPEDEPNLDAVAPDEAPVVDETSTITRPANAHNRDKWDAYARAMKIDPTQFKTKDELIAAIPA